MFDKKADHWSIDRSDANVLDFCDDDKVVAAMMYWLKIDRTHDEDMLIECFGCFNEYKQLEILTEYIEAHEDEKTAFNDWYNMKYYGDMDDWAYEQARDIELEEKYGEYV